LATLREVLSGGIRKVDYFFENSLPIWICGALLVTIALVVYQQTRSRGALAAVLVAVLLTALGLVAEKLIVTPREAVEQTLYGLAAAIEADNLPAVLTYIAPNAAEVRGDAEAIMPQLIVEKCRVASELVIEVDETAQPMTAVARFKALGDVTMKRNNMRGGYFDKVEIRFTRDPEGRWLVEGYTPARDLRGAVGR
jgi:hypothetical protein